MISTNPYQNAFQIISLANEYYQESEKIEENSSKLVDIFYALVLLEMLLDKQRVLTEAGASFNNPEGLKKVNQFLDDLRDKIIKLRDRIGLKTAKEVLFSMGENIKRSYQS